MRRLPTRDELVAFIRDHSGKVGTREIARAFGAKNADRAALNRMLRELAEEGTVDQQRKKLHNPGTLPPVVMADVTGRDSDGELLARPTEWDEEAHGAPPVIRIVMPRRTRPGEVPGVGDRALIRIEKTEEEAASGRVIKLIDRAKNRVLGIFRELPGGGGRLVPIDKKQLGRELGIAAGATAGAADGDLVAVEVARQNRFGLTAAKVVERLGSLKSERAVSLIAIHAHAIPYEFPRAVIDEAEAARPVSAAHREAWREDWRAVPFVTIDPPDAKDHDDAVHALPDPDPNNAGGFLVERRYRRRRALCAARFGAGSRSAAARQFGVFSRSRRADAAGTHFQRSLLAAAERGSRRACGAHGDRRRRPQTLAHFSSRFDPLGRETLL